MPGTFFRREQRWLHSLDDPPLSWIGQQHVQSEMPPSKMPGIFPDAIDVETDWISLDATLVGFPSEADLSVACSLHAALSQ
jgi:hypothetical protein